MAFQSVPETAEVVIRFTLHGQEMVNVLAARLVGGYDLAALQSLADAVDTAVGLNFLPEQTLDLVYNDTTARGLEFINDEVAIANAATGPGEDTAIGLPGNVTLSVKKGSGLTGRSARGRLYWVGIPRTQLSGNENLFLAAYTVRVAAALEAVRLAISGTAWSPVIISRFSGGVPRALGVTFFWSTTTIVNINVDSSRGRLVN